MTANPHWNRQFSSSFAASIIPIRRGVERAAALAGQQNALWRFAAAAGYEVVGRYV